ncbi:MAG: hypothetical protein WDO24_02655 [Pseudomonadota bacterium]
MTPSVQLAHLKTLRYAVTNPLVVPPDDIKAKISPVDKMVWPNYPSTSTSSRTGSSAEQGDALTRQPSMRTIAAPGVGQLPTPAPVRRGAARAAARALARRVLPGAAGLEHRREPTLQGRIAVARQYERVLGDSYYLLVIGQTLTLGVGVTLLCVLLGYPLALAVARSNGWVKSALIFVTVAPLLINVVVRSYGWMVILGGTGLVNTALAALGLPKAELMYNWGDRDARPGPHPAAVHGARGRQHDRNDRPDAGRGRDHARRAAIIGAAPHHRPAQPGGRRDRRAARLHAVGRQLRDRRPARRYRDDDLPVLIYQQLTPWSRTGRSPPPWEPSCWPWSPSCSGSRPGTAAARA